MPVQITFHHGVERQVKTETVEIPVSKSDVSPVMLFSHNDAIAALTSKGYSNIIIGVVLPTQ